jgi:hypothetical protein
MAKRRSTAEKALKKMHPAYVVIIVISLVIGLAAGYFAANFIYGKDTLALVGDKTTYVSAGKSVSYTDEGIKYISKGKNLSDKVEIETNMAIVDGKYTGTPTEDNELYIIYKITDGRAQGKTLYRVFRVNAELQEGGAA